MIVRVGFEPTHADRRPLEHLFIGMNWSPTPKPLGHRTDAVMGVTKLIYDRHRRNTTS